MNRQPVQIEAPAQAAEVMLGGAQLQEQALDLDCSGCRLRLRSNSARLIERLRGYFAHIVSTDGAPDMEVIAIDGPVLELANRFIDWRREPGKMGRKDAYVELPGARLIRKVRTGMLFLQSQQWRIAAGPCQRYDNQLINFINAQYMNWLQQRGWLICHASGLVKQGRVLAMAGLSGGGKSTLMLQLLEQDDIGYLTNDRLFIRRGARGVEARGIPKLPRINPGTIVHNPRLEPLIPAARRAELLALPNEQLWEIEEKYDVDVERFYGTEHIQHAGVLQGFLVLNWRRGSSEPLVLQRVELAQRRDLLGAIMKSPGPFYQFADGHFLGDEDPLDAQAYLELLRETPVWEASGGVDFAGLSRRCHDELLA